MFKRQGTKHCCWGLCKSDSRYPDRLPEGTFFIPFPKPGKVRDNMTQLEREHAKLRTEKAKRWQFLCGRADFQSLEQIKGSTYICSLHFVGGKGPTPDNDEPTLATLTAVELSRKQQRCKRRAPAARPDYTACPPKRGRKRLVTAEDEESSLPQEPAGQETAGETTEIALGTTSPEQESVARTDDKSTQTVYNRYVLGAKIETMILKHDATLQNEKKEAKTINKLDPSIVLKDCKNTKFFLGLFPEQFDIL